VIWNSVVPSSSDEEAQMRGFDRRPCLHGGVSAYFDARGGTLVLLYLIILAVVLFCGGGVNQDTTTPLCVLIGRNLNSAVAACGYRIA
jgi:hypothetical protein